MILSSAKFETCSKFTPDLTYLRFFTFSCQYMKINRLCIYVVRILIKPWCLQPGIHSKKKRFYSIPNSDFPPNFILLSLTYMKLHYAARDAAAAKIICQGTRFARTLTYTMMRISETIGDPDSVLWNHRAVGVHHRRALSSDTISQKPRRSGCAAGVTWRLYNYKVSIPIRLDARRPGDARVIPPSKFVVSELSDGPAVSPASIRSPTDHIPFEPPKFHFPAIAILRFQSKIESVSTGFLLFSRHKIADSFVSGEVSYIGYDTCAL